VHYKALFSLSAMQIHADNNTRRLTLTVSEVKDYLGLSEASVYRALHKGEIPAERVGGSWLVLKEAFFSKFGRPPAGRPSQRRRTLRKLAAAADRALLASEDATAPSGAQASIPQEKPSDNMLTGDEYETPESAAKRIGVGPRYVREVLCASAALYHHKIGKKYKILKASVDAYIKRISRGEEPTP
jgi:excisionase family DNA binding protein